MCSSPMSTDLAGMSLVTKKDWLSWTSRAGFRDDDGWLRDFQTFTGTCESVISEMTSDFTQPPQLSADDDGTSDAETKLQRETISTPSVLLSRCDIGVGRSLIYRAALNPRRSASLDSVGHKVGPRDKIHQSKSLHGQLVGSVKSETCVSTLFRTAPNNNNSLTESSVGPSGAQGQTAKKQTTEVVGFAAIQGREWCLINHRSIKMTEVDSTFSGEETMDKLRRRLTISEAVMDYRDLLGSLGSRVSSFRGGTCPAAASRQDYLSFREVLQTYLVHDCQLSPASGILEQAKAPDNGSVVSQGDRSTSFVMGESNGTASDNLNEGREGLGDTQKMECEDCVCSVEHLMSSDISGTVSSGTEAGKGISKSTLNTPLSKGIALARKRKSSSPLSLDQSEPKVIVRRRLDIEINRSWSGFSGHPRSRSPTPTGRENETAHDRHGGSVHTGTSVRLDRNHRKDSDSSCHELEESSSVRSLPSGGHSRSPIAVRSLGMLEVCLQKKGSASTGVKRKGKRGGSLSPTFLRRHALDRDDKGSVGSNTSGHEAEALSRGDHCLSRRRKKCCCECCSRDERSFSRRNRRLRRMRPSPFRRIRTSPFRRMRPSPCRRIGRTSSHGLSRSSSHVIRRSSSRRDRRSPSRRNRRSPSRRNRRSPSRRNRRSPSRRDRRSSSRRDRRSSRRSSNVRNRSSPSLRNRCSCSCRNRLSSSFRNTPSSSHISSSSCRDRLSPSLLNRCSPSCRDRLSPSLLNRCSPSCRDRRSPSLLNRCSPSCRDRCSPSLLNRCSPSCRDRLSPSLMNRRSPNCRDRRSPSLLNKCSPSCRDRLSPSLMNRRSPSCRDRCSPSLLNRCSPSCRDRLSPSLMNRRSPSCRDRRSPSLMNKRSPSCRDRRSPSLMNRRSPSCRGRRSPSLMKRRSPSLMNRRSPSCRDRRSSSDQRRTEKFYSTDSCKSRQTIHMTTTHDNDLIGSTHAEDKFICAPINDPNDGEASCPLVFDGELSLSKSQDADIQNINYVSSNSIKETIGLDWNFKEEFNVKENLDEELNVKESFNEEFNVRENLNLSRDLTDREIKNATDIFFGETFDLNESIDISRVSRDGKINNVLNITSEETFGFNNTARTFSNVATRSKGRIKGSKLATTPMNVRCYMVSIGEQNSSDVADCDVDLQVEVSRGSDDPNFDGASSDACDDARVLESRIPDCPIRDNKHTNAAEADNDCSDLIGLEQINRLIIDGPSRGSNVADESGPIVYEDQLPIFLSGDLKDRSIRDSSNSPSGDTFDWKTNVQFSGSRVVAASQHQTMPGQRSNVIDAVDRRIDNFTGFEQIDNILNGATSVGHDEGEIDSNVIASEVATPRESVRRKISDHARHVSSDETFDTNDSFKASGSAVASLRSHARAVVDTSITRVTIVGRSPRVTSTPAACYGEPLVAASSANAGGESGLVGENNHGADSETDGARTTKRGVPPHSHECTYRWPERIELCEEPSSLLQYGTALDVESTGSLYARVPYAVLQKCVYSDPRRCFLNVHAPPTRRGDGGFAPLSRKEDTMGESKLGVAPVGVEINHVIQIPEQTATHRRADDVHHGRPGFTPAAGSSGCTVDDVIKSGHPVTRPALHMVVPRAERRLPKLTDSIICSILTKAQTVSILDELCDVPRPISPLPETLGLLSADVSTKHSVQFSGQDIDANIDDTGQRSILTSISDHHREGQVESFIPRSASICLLEPRVVIAPCQEAFKKLPHCFVKEPNSNIHSQITDGGSNAVLNAETNPNRKQEKPASLKTACFLYLAKYQSALASCRHARDSHSQLTTAQRMRVDDSENEEKTGGTCRLPKRKRGLEYETPASEEYVCKRRKVKTETTGVLYATSFSDDDAIEDRNSSNNNEDDTITEKQSHNRVPGARCVTSFEHSDEIVDDNSNNGDDDVEKGDKGGRLRVKADNLAGNSESYFCDDISTPIVLNAPDRVYHVSCRACPAHTPTLPLIDSPSVLRSNLQDQDVDISWSADPGADENAVFDEFYHVTREEPDPSAFGLATSVWGAETGGSELAESQDSMQDVLARAMENAGLSESEVRSFLVSDDPIQSCLFGEKMKTEDKLYLTLNAPDPDIKEALPGEDTELDDNSVSTSRGQDASDYCYYDHMTDMKSASLTDQHVMHFSFDSHTDDNNEYSASNLSAFPVNPITGGRENIFYNSTHFTMTSLEGEDRALVNLDYNDDVWENVPGCMGDDDTAVYVDDPTDRVKYDWTGHQSGGKMEVGMLEGSLYDGDELSITHDPIHLAEALSLFSDVNNACDLGSMSWGPGDVAVNEALKLSLDASERFGDCYVPEHLEDSLSRNAKFITDVAATEKCFVRLERIDPVLEESKFVGDDSMDGYSKTMRQRKRKLATDGFGSDRRYCDCSAHSEQGTAKAECDDDATKVHKDGPALTQDKVRGDTGGRVPGNTGVTTRSGCGQAALRGGKQSKTARVKKGEERNLRSAEHGAVERMARRTGRLGSPGGLSLITRRQVTVSQGTTTPSRAVSDKTYPITARQLDFVSPVTPSDYFNREMQEADQFKQQLVKSSPGYLTKMKHRRKRGARSELTYPLVRRSRRIPFFLRSDPLIDWVGKVSEEALDHNNSASWDGNTSGVSKVKPGAKKTPPRNQGKTQELENRLHLPRVCDKKPSLDKEKKFEKMSEKLFRQHQNLHQAPSRLSLLSDGGLIPSDANSRKHEISEEIHQLPEICPSRNLNDNQHKRHSTPAETVCALPAMRSASAQGSAKVLNFVKRLDTRYGDQLAHGDADTRQRLNKFCKSYLTSHGVPKRVSTASGQGDKKAKEDQVCSAHRGATDKLDDDINLLAAHNLNLSQTCTNSTEKKDGKSSTRTTPLPSDGVVHPAIPSKEIQNVPSGQVSAPSKRVFSGKKLLDSKTKVCVKKISLRPDIASSVNRLTSKPASPTSRLMYKIHDFEKEFHKPLSIGGSPQTKPAVAAGSSKSFTASRFRAIRDRPLGDVKKLLTTSGAGDSKLAALDINWSKACPGKDQQPAGSGASKVKKTSTVTGELSLDEFSDEHIKDDELETRQTIMASLPNLYKFSAGEGVPEKAECSTETNEQCEPLPRSKSENKSVDRTDTCSEVDVKPLAQLKQMMDRSFSIEYPYFHEHGHSSSGTISAEGKTLMDLNTTLKKTSIFGKDGGKSSTPDCKTAVQTSQTESRSESRPLSVGNVRHSASGDPNEMGKSGRARSPASRSSTSDRPNKFHSIALPAGITEEFFRDSECQPEAEGRPETLKELHEELDEFLDEFKDDYDKELLEEEDDDDYLPEFDDSDLHEVGIDGDRSAVDTTPHAIPDALEVVTFGGYDCESRPGAREGVTSTRGYSTRSEAGAATDPKVDGDVACGDGPSENAGQYADIFKVESLDSIRRSVDDSFGTSFHELAETMADDTAERGDGLWGDALGYWPPLSYAPEKRTFKKLTPIQEAQDEDEASVFMDEQ